MQMSIFKQLAVSVAVCALLGAPAFAETRAYTADLTAAAEVPPTDSTATGTAEVTVDTAAHTVSWVVSYKGLTGDATAAHIHGPASVTENAPPVLDMSQAIMAGNAEITDEQLGDLKAGKYYVNVHTAKHPDGEIRGQLMAKK